VSGEGRARALDEADDLAPFRERFVVDEPGLVYLDGNSLGRLPKAAAAMAETVVHYQWGERLIRSWNEGWLDLPRRIGAKIARVIGAEPDEVIVADSTSVNLFKLALAALRARPGRSTVVTDGLNFPSDLYILGSVVELAGGRLEVAPSPDGVSVPVDALADRIDGATTLVALCHTTFKSAFIHDMAAVTELAHRSGALALWDLSHSAGAIPVALRASGADLAVGCTYKYLNGGPGAPAYLYVRRELQEELLNPVSGWLGRRDPFSFAPDYVPEEGIRRFITGTPPVLSLALIEPGVDLVLEAGLDRIRAKSVRQTELLIELWRERLRPLGFALRSPLEAERRGSHVALGHPEGLRISRALVERMSVIPDFRPPDNLRLGVCPLYTTFVEIHGAIRALETVVKRRLYEACSAASGGAI
jgi:kynureninase